MAQPDPPWAALHGSPGRGGLLREVAKQFGVTRQEVCHYVTLVKRLPEDLVELVAAERDSVRARRFNLRVLLRIVRLATTEEKRGQWPGSSGCSPGRIAHLASRRARSGWRQTV
jgi:hypothetical protein